MLKLNNIRFLAIFVLIAALSACSDNGTGPDNGQPPKVPDLSKAFSVDLSYFGNASSTAPQSKTTSANTPIVSGINNNFNTRQAFVETIEALLNSSDDYSGFLGNASSHSAKFKNGQWVWTYNYDYNGSSASVKLTAKGNKGPKMNSWVLYISYSTGNTQVKNYKFMEGIVSKDGSTGHWQINGFGEQSDYKLTADWAIKTNDSKVLTFAYYQNGDKEDVLTYSAKPPSYKINTTFLASNDTYILYWNTDTGNGYWKDNNNKKCWDENFQNIPCSNLK